MQEVRKDSILSVRAAQLTELKEDYDGAVGVIEDQRIENMILKDEVTKLKKHRKILLSVSGSLAGLVALFIILP